MKERAVLISNNPGLCRQVSAMCSDAGDSVVMVEGSSLDVLITARDAIHLGSRLLTHPLCGNLRPSQQPFRSVLIKKESSDSLVDLDSLSMIERAVLIYRGFGGNLSMPGSLPEDIREDYAFVDSELMRDSLLQYGFSLALTPWGVAPDPTQGTQPLENPV